jgi:ATP-dependent DNA helicase DinG
VRDACVQLQDTLRDFAEALAPLREAAPGFDSCHARAVDFAGRLRRWLEGPEAADFAEVEDDIRWCARRLLV